jgi:hypothetical protein
MQSPTRGACGSRSRSTIDSQPIYFFLPFSLANYKYQLTLAYLQGLDHTSIYCSKSLSLAVSGGILGWLAGF